MGRTDLATAANVNYKRLAKCLELLQEAGLAESAIKDGPIVINLTLAGRNFASTLLEIGIMRL